MDLIDVIVEFCCYYYQNIDMKPILLAIFTPHIEVITITLQNNAINKNGLLFLRTGIEALEYTICSDFYQQLAEKVLPLLFTIIKTQLKEHEIIENTCSCIRRILRDMAIDFKPYIEPLVNSIITAFENTKHPTYLYISSVIVDEFGKFANKDIQIANILQTMVYRIFDLTIPCLTQEPIIKDQETMSQFDQTIEDFFVLIKRQII